QKRGDGERVREAVPLLQAAAPLAEPDVPLVEGNVQGTLGPTRIPGALDQGFADLQRPLCMVGLEHVRVVVMAACEKLEPMVVNNIGQPVNHPPIPLVPALLTAA